MGPPRRQRQRRGTSSNETKRGKHASILVGWRSEDVLAGIQGGLMNRVARVLVALSASMFLLNITVAPPASADPCPETEVARIACPIDPSKRIFVCQDHHGVITAHQHCIVPR
jgi:hypothetical protein